MTAVGIADTFKDDETPSVTEPIERQVLGRAPHERQTSTVKVEAGNTSDNGLRGDVNGNAGRYALRDGVICGWRDEDGIDVVAAVGEHAFDHQPAFGDEQSLRSEPPWIAHAAVRREPLVVFAVDQSSR